MTNTLSPRDIQARIRGGASLADVVAESGMPAEKVEPFAAPILAEREHVAGTAQTQPVRRGRDSSGHRTLRTVVHERLMTRGVDLEEVGWDAWREEDRSWTIAVRYRSGGTEHDARFRYDMMGRFSVAKNDDATWLTGETQAATPTPRIADPDHEPTVDFSDEFAIVRAVGAEAPREEVPVAPAAVVPQPSPVDDEIDDDLSEPELTEVDGVYDIVPGRGELDNLYDMFSAFNEDSVEIYPGLGEVAPVGSPRTRGSEPAEVQPVEPEPIDAVGGREQQLAQLSRRQRRKLAEEKRRAEQAAATRDEPEQLDLVAHAEDTAPAEQVVAEIVDTPVEEDPVVEPAAAEPREAELAGQHEPATAERGLRAEAPSVAEVAHKARQLDDSPAPTAQPKPQVAGQRDPQPTEQAPRAEASAPDDAELTVTLPKPKRTTKKKRASVPSWDEIMFGSPKKD